MTVRLVSMGLILILVGCAEHKPIGPGYDGGSDESAEAIESLKPFGRMWALTQGARPIREEFGPDCLVALNVYYTTAITDHVLVLRSSPAMEASPFAKKRVAMFDTVIHSRGGESIDLPHQVRLAIQEREFGIATFQRLYVGLDIAGEQAKNPVEIKAGTDATEFRSQYGKVCEDKHFAGLIHP